MGMDNIDAQDQIPGGSWRVHAKEFPEGAHIEGAGLDRRLIVETDSLYPGLEDRLERRWESWKQAFALGFIAGAWATLAVFLIVQAVVR